MSENRRLFPYEKAVVLNALYDALDALSFGIDQANSIQGALVVSSAGFPSAGGRLAISPTLSGGETLVEVFPDGADAEQAEWPAALIDEMQALIKKAGMEKRK